jgi:hypothetical protein
MNLSDHPSIDLDVGRGGGLRLQINDRSVDETYGAIVMAELMDLYELPAKQLAVNVHSRQRPIPVAMAHLIAGELERNQVSA